MAFIALAFALVVIVAGQVSGQGSAVVATIDDFNAIPFFILGDEKGRTGYREFLRKSFPRAFVVASSGTWAWNTGAHAAARALASCGKNTTATCILYAVDDQVQWKPDPGASLFADESADWGVAPTTELRTATYHAPTPTTIPGIATITTIQLRDMLASERKPVVIDVLGGTGHLTLPDAVWAKGMGLGFSTESASQQRFTRLLEQVTAGDKSREIVTVCLSSHCWLSYNAALRAASLGYSKVRWYRGGVFAWRAAGLPTVEAKRYPIAE